MNHRIYVKNNDLATQEFTPSSSALWASRFAEPTDAQLEGWAPSDRGIRSSRATGLGQDARRLLTATRPVLREAKERGGCRTKCASSMLPLRRFPADIQRTRRAAARESGRSPGRENHAGAQRRYAQTSARAMLRTPPHIW